MFECGEKHPKYIDLSVIEEELSSIDIGTLKIVPGSIRREGNHRKIDAHCDMCHVTSTVYVDNIRSGKTKGCRCLQRAGKYRDFRANVLGERYDAMIQRCYRDTHVSSHNYKGRGIKVEFLSREDFVRWGLQTFPNEDFRGKDFDRLDNDGNYSKENLRLVDRSTNLMNRRNSRKGAKRG